MKRSLHDRIRRGLLRIVRMCKVCGEPYEVNITYEDDGQCCACDAKAIAAAATP